MLNRPGRPRVGPYPRRRRRASPRSRACNDPGHRRSEAGVRDQAPLAAAGTVLLFLFAVQLLGASTEAAAPWIRRLLLRLLRSDGSAIGPGRSLLLAVAALFGSLKLFDRVLSRIGQQALRDRLLTRFERPWLSFALGLVVTGLTTSITFSLGVLVPLYNRRYIEREELVPFVLGANIGTLLDTLAVALVLGAPTGIAVVLAVIALATSVTLVALSALGPYRRWIGAADDRLLADRTVFVGFVAVLVLLPVGLLVLPAMAG